jgi:hypothetical protein
MAHQGYRSSGAGQYIDCFSRTGDRVLLEDRSVWALDPADAARVRRWTRFTEVEVRETATHGYVLVARCHDREERVFVGFRGFLAETPVEMALAS